MTPPPVSVIALNRLAFGPRAGDVEALEAVGLPAWVDAQLRPDDADDAVCRAKLAATTVRIAYEAGEEEGTKWPKVDEDRPLTCLDKSPADLWHLADWSRKMAYAERARPLAEVRAATWVRAVYSRWQLREVLVDFWHNHFNVNADVDVAAHVAFPAYDRDVIRRHALGNFRQLLEAVATSVPMLRYLNNAGSRASPANENYARELFELHTLGAEHYLNHLYNRWRDVPGAVDGRPAGYIDQDVYEAARAFTGWTYAAGQWARDGEVLPKTGAFTYVEHWHDNYQKRVLGAEFDPNQPPMADGRRVLDLVAAHPGTARHVCRKLCRRLVADDVPDDLLAVAVEAWTAHRDAADQIARTVRAIALSPQFAGTWGGKVKRPLEYAASLIRATGADFAPDHDFLWAADQTGQRLFAWPTPVGHPDTARHWLGAGVMLSRWTLPLAVVQGWLKDSLRVRLLQAMPDDVVTCRQTVEYWAKRVLGYLPGEATLGPLLAYAATGTTGPDAPLPASGDGQLAERVTGLVALIAMTPEFHLR